MSELKHYIAKFENQGYVHITDFLDKKNCEELTQELFKSVSNGKSKKDYQCPLSESIRDNSTFDKLLEDLLPYFEQYSGKKLYPTYAYARLYKPGEELQNHRDRPACEISATITLGYLGKQWPIYMGNYEDKRHGSEIKMNVGDAVLYKGEEKWHWREKFEGEWQAQVFLHYVDVNGKNTEWKYDKRSKLAHHTENNSISNNNDEQILFWYYTDILTEKACDIIINTYDKDFIAKEKPYIGGDNFTINLNVRNVERIMLPTYKDIGGRLAAAALDANQQVWKFNIKRANQSEFLKYPAEGKYEAHVDTFITPNQKECRKLTALAFLNDDFKGGKFFLQDGHEKIYPPQKKGTVLIFPSFLIHGVEPVEEGTRYSVVTWMVGPWFK